MRALILIAVLMLAACGDYAPATKENSNKWLMPEGLADCKVYDMTSTQGAWMRVVRCPNSDTTTTVQSGKTTTVVTVTETKAVKE